MEISVFPVEETIIDPLYEPLKLNRYELCPHLTMLNNVSHLNYGFSPYLLFDVWRWKAVVGVIKDIEIDEQINSILECREFLDTLETYLIKLEALKDIGKKDRNEHLSYLKTERNLIKRKYKEIKGKYKIILDMFFYNLLFSIDAAEFEATLESNLISDKLINEFTKKNISLDVKDTILKAKDNKWIIADKFYAFKEDGNINIYKRDFIHFKQNFNRLIHIFQLDYPVKVECPICRKHQFMCEEGKIYTMKESLLRTFELRRAKWLQMSGSLHVVHRASTHTRLSHQIGSMIVAVNALKEIDVYPVEDLSMLLGEYLQWKGELHEFLIANFLHDIGHSPLSHVLEPNPFTKLDHEAITTNLICGRNVDNNEGVDWYIAEKYLLKLKTIKAFEYKFFDNIDDQIYNVGEENWSDEERNKKFLSYLNENNNILESEIITVSDTLENYCVDKRRIAEFLKGKTIHSEAKIMGENGERTNIFDTIFLNKLIDSDIDFDRIDHVKRDSVVCGLSQAGFRLLELLGSFSIVLPDSNVYKEIYNSQNDKPYILISEDGLLSVINLLNTRKCVFNDILYSDENNWINGVINQITAMGVKKLPHIKNMLPFVTDQILMHIFSNDMFLGTQIEKFNKLFNGKMDCSAYIKPMRFKLKHDVPVEKKYLESMYELIEDKNNRFQAMEFPAIVFYTNIKEKKDTDNKEKEGWEDIFVYGKKFNTSYYKFQEIVKEGGLIKDKFPDKPSESDVKNLFYVWINNIAISNECDEIKWKSTIKSWIGGVFKDNKNGQAKNDKLNIESFDKIFIDLNVL